MAKRGRPSRNQAQPLNPSPTVPNYETEMVVNDQDVNSIGTASDANIQEKRRKNARTTTLVAQPLNPSPAVPNPQTETLVNNAQDVNSMGTPSDANVLEKRRTNARSTTLVVRRSQRLSSPTQVNSLEPVVEDIIITEVEKEKELPTNEDNHSPERTQDAPTTQPSPVETTGLNYRSMYIDSQMKINSLMKKNRKLRRNLKCALGKIEVYAEMKPILSSLSKANEILCNRPWTTRRLRT